MPRLVKGGKYVYGLSVVSPDGTIPIPSEAMEEYHYRAGDRVIVMSGSRKSGGFAITKADKLERSALSTLISDLPGLAAYTVPEGKIIRSRGRLFAWTVIRDGGGIRLPLDTLAAYGLRPGDRLAVGRGSHLAIAFIARGPILEEALRHSELAVFGD
jgi:bifunctional DNA-binding transcriptional regulator/antitoxin component of YhaV-PrlF toxin-antitoxin module